MDAVFARIVVTLDGSATTEQALPPAIELVRRLGAPLHHLRVVDLGRLEQYGVFGLALEYSVPDIALQDERIAARDDLERLQERFAGEGLPGMTETREGFAAREMVDAVQPGGLPVMASHGRTGVPRWFLGGVAEEATRRRAPDPSRRCSRCIRTLRSTGMIWRPGTSRRRS